MFGDQVGTREPLFGVRGGRVSWFEMSRWLDIRTLAWWSKEAVWVLYGKLGMDEIWHVKTYC